ncbi:hypothetical protein HMPREF9466_01908 [Fusobacterium necrophorum subsp. funduliforme 1_1_36S]|nr:hypothetical protein HMPREF9466_01908 [Fusobacterium necrophorum subsp. funduliforme 1_1_36S]
MEGICEKYQVIYQKVLGRFHEVEVIQNKKKNKKSE